MEAVKQETVDLIHLGDVDGSRVVLRLKGPVAKVGSGSDVLAGEIIVDSSFISGRISTWLFPEDLASWEAGLETLASGQSISWRKDLRATEIHIDHDADPERVIVTVADRHDSLADAVLTVNLAAGWLDDHRARLVAVRDRWPL